MPRPVTCKHGGGLTVEASYLLAGGGTIGAPYGCLLFKPRDGAPSWIARENGKFMVTLPDGTQLTSTITIGKANEKSKDCPSLKMQWVLEDAQASSDPDWMGDNGTAAPDDDIL